MATHPSLTSQLSALWNLYLSSKEHHWTVGNRRTFGALPSLAQAIQYAAPGSKIPHPIHPHLHHVGYPRLRTVQAVLLSNQVPIAACPNFSAVYTLVSSLIFSTKGISLVTVYDVTAQICCQMGYRPVDIYLKAGTLAGVVQLDRALKRQGKSLHGFSIRSATISPRTLPSPLNSKPADDLEDFFCVMKICLGGIVP